MSLSQFLVSMRGGKKLYHEAPTTLRPMQRETPSDAQAYGEIPVKKAAISQYSLCRERASKQAVEKISGA